MMNKRERDSEKPHILIILIHEGFEVTTVTNSHSLHMDFWWYGLLITYENKTFHGPTVEYLQLMDV